MNAADLMARYAEIRDEVWAAVAHTHTPSSAMLEDLVALVGYRRQLAAMDRRDPTAKQKAVDWAKDRLHRIAALKSAWRTLPAAEKPR